MAKRSYALEFDGYWREPNWSGLPAESGIYCVYACAYDSGKGTVSIKRLLYVGESGNVRKRVPEEPRNRRDKWAGELNRGEVLCVSCAKITAAVRERVEAAIIYRHEPPCNTEYVDFFPFDATTVSTDGKKAKLSQSFAVERDD